MQQEVDASGVSETCYTAQKIFLSKSSVDRIDPIRQSLMSNASMYQLLIAPRPAELAQWIKVYGKVNDKIPPAIAALEAELRALMGDVEEPQT
jgi:hypothetical protein